MRPRNPLPALALTLALAFSPLMVPGPSRADGIRLEAEDLITSGNTGQETIHVVECSEASQGHAIQGVDLLGEWIAFRLTLNEQTCFRDSLRTAGAVPLVRQFAVLYQPDPPATTSAADSAMSAPGTGAG